MITMKSDEDVSLDLEELGAYLEGTLDEDEHARMEEVLAHDERAREVYAETLRHLDEVAKVDHGSEVIEFPKSRERRGFVGLLAIAASLCILFRIYSSGPPPESLSMPQINELLPSMPPGMTSHEYYGEKWEKPLWSGTRTAETATDDVRLGAWLVILRAALDGDESAIAQRVARRIAQTIADRNTISARDYRELAAALEAAEAAQEFLVDADAAERRLLKAADSGRFDRASLDLGRWAAAGRLAALAEALDPKIFARALDEGGFADHLGAEQTQRFGQLFTETPTNQAALVLAFTEVLAAAA